MLSQVVRRDVPFLGPYADGWEPVSYSMSEPLLDFSSHLFLTAKTSINPASPFCFESSPHSTIAAKG